MVPCYGRITLNTKGCANSDCANSCFLSKRDKSDFFDNQGELRESNIFRERRQLTSSSLGLQRKIKQGGIHEQEGTN
jgi:hypothetical protein